MTLSDKQWLFLQDVSKLIIAIRGFGYKATGGHLERDADTQQRLYDAGLSKAKPGQSQHQNKLAIDLNIWDVDGSFLGSFPREHQKERLQKIGDYWESLDPKNSWGGNWKTFFDPRHFERRP